MTNSKKSLPIDLSEATWADLQAENAADLLDWDQVQEWEDVEVTEITELDEASAAAAAPLPAAFSYQGFRDVEVAPTLEADSPRYGRHSPFMAAQSAQSTPPAPAPVAPAVPPLQPQPAEAAQPRSDAPDVSSGQARVQPPAVPAAPLSATVVETSEDLRDSFTEVHFYVGKVNQETVAEAIRGIVHLPIETPPERTAARRLRMVLGSGEACFLRAQSGFFSWRTHKLPSLQMHIDGPPSVGRNVMMEHRFGPVTVLQGCRIAQVTEQPRLWTMTVVSVEEQALRLKEQYTLRWLDDDSVALEVQSQWQIAVKGLRLMGLLVSNMQKKVMQGYLKNLTDLMKD